MFIERDRERFRHCLDCMRDGNVHLLPVVSKEALFSDLEYFAFEDVNESDVDRRVSNRLHGNEVVSSSAFDYVEDSPPPRV